MGNIESTVLISVEGAIILHGVLQKELMQRERVLSVARTAHRDTKAVTIVNDSISRRAAIEEVKRLHDVAWANWKETKISANTMIDALKNLPSTGRPTGKWINREKCQVDEDAYEVATCSECGAEITIEYPYDNYCPNCGADMSTRGIVKHEPI